MWTEEQRAIGVVTPLRTCGSAGGSVAKGMKKISYRGYRFPPEIIHQAIWLYLRFTLSLRDVEDLLDQAPRDGTVIVAGRLEGADHRLAIGSQRLDQAVVLGTRVENG